MSLLSSTSKTMTDSGSVRRPSDHAHTSAGRPASRVKKTMSGYDIYIVGLGILSSLQVTRETEQTLRLCKTVFFLHPEAKWVQKYLESLCPNVVDLDSCYTEDVLRGEAYKKMVETVFNAAREDAPVALALYGHPMVFVSPSKTILRDAPDAGFKAKMLPAVSSLDCMFVDLEVDPSEGLMMYECNEMLLYRRSLQPDLHCIIWQPGSVESEVFTKRINRPERFLRLKEYLLQFYPGDHVVTIITCSLNPIVESKVTKVPLGELETKNIQLHAGATLYIPRLDHKGDRDEEFRKLLLSEQHVRAITDDPQQMRKSNARVRSLGH